MTTPTTAAATAVATRTATTKAATHRQRGGPRRLARLVNPLVLLLAGTPIFPLYGVLEHRGRRTGKAFRIPVVVRPTADGFVVPMPWGEHTDWCRNVRAAGGCVVRWKGRDYPMVQPEVIADRAAASALFGTALGTLLARLGITHSLRLRHRSERWSLAR
jgi:deazaflavin-dependent oxidoreductase (nitroreductase family)